MLLGQFLQLFCILPLSHGNTLIIHFHKLPSLFPWAGVPLPPLADLRGRRFPTGSRGRSGRRRPPFGHVPAAVSRPRRPSAAVPSGRVPATVPGSGPLRGPVSRFSARFSVFRGAVFSRSVCMSSPRRSDLTNQRPPLTPPRPRPIL